MDGAESSSESEMDVDDQSDEEMNTKVNLFFFYVYKNNQIKNIFFHFVPVRHFYCSDYAVLADSTEARETGHP